MRCFLTADVRQQVSDILNLFTGTHNFHNFTSGKYAIIDSYVLYDDSTFCLQLVSNAKFVFLRLVLFCLICHSNFSFVFRYLVYVNSVML